MVYSDLVYDAERLGGRTVERVHCACLLLYRHSKESVAVSQDLLDLANRSEGQYEIVDRIVDIEEESDVILLNIQWLGLPNVVDRTWVSLQTMFEDMPDTVIDFIQTQKAKKTLIKPTKQSINLTP